MSNTKIIAEREDLVAIADATRNATGTTEQMSLYGIANAINEMASKAGVGVVLEQDSIPIKEEVHAVSEMLGIDPFEVANEGKVVMGVKADKADAVLEAIKGEKYGENAAIIGEVVEGDYVIVNTPIGGERILEAPIADPVPRVC